MKRPLEWTCCPGGWERAYGEGAVGHQLEMMVSEVAFQLESEVGKLFLGLIHNVAYDEMIDRVIGPWLR